MNLIIVEYNPGSGMQNFVFNTKDKDFFKTLKDSIKFITNEDILIKKSLVKELNILADNIHELLNTWSQENEYLVFTV